MTQMEPPQIGPLRRALGFFRSIAAEIRYAPERMLHGVRRARVQREIAATARISSVMFVCYGNVCRSPFAAAVFARSARGVLANDLSVTSSGFVGPGRQPPAQALAAARRRGFEMEDHRSSLVTADRVHAASLIVVMSTEQVRALRKSFGGTSARIVVLGDLDPLPIRRRTVLDPWGRDDARFDESYDRIQRCIAALLVQSAS